MVADTLVFSGWYLSPSQESAECWDPNSISLCLSNLCSAARHSKPHGFLGFLPEMISKAGENSPVLLACRAIAQAFLTSKVSTAKAKAQRALVYGEALTATNAAIQDPALQTQDETLTCVWLLSMYEVRELLATMTKDCLQPDRGGRLLPRVSFQRVNSFPSVR